MEGQGGHGPLGMGPLGYPPEKGQNSPREDGKSAESSKIWFPWQDVFFLKGKQPSLRAKKILFGDFIAGPEPGLAPPQDWLEKATVLMTHSYDEATSSHPTPAPSPRVPNFSGRRRPERVLLLMEV